ncbi:MULTISPECIES: IS630 family transposase [unclassified Moorena]|uniref:IS630 family transposase n=1 Tax=unclassified Moorena TaxID=2683338 RepID=UPI0013FE7D22|nr:MULTISPECIES: IS630 family transposase [unclassified Moorena]NEO10997.1 IS630 family transposase [Moorena sp. SIO3E8]NEP99111.1 IS630 family transposase [Moorena sp. SIO3F7]
MRFIRELNTETKKLLERISWQSKYPQVRDRANCILLSYKKFSINELSSLFGVTRTTIYNWLNKWEYQKIIGIYNQKGRGRKPKLNQEQKQQVKEWVNSEPKSLNSLGAHSLGRGTRPGSHRKVKIKINKEWKIDVSKETIKRTIKKLNMKWKRMKRGTSKTPDDWELEVKIPRLKELKEQAKKGEIELRYLDESGFSLKPDIPYGWQEKLKRITLNSSQSKRINVLGLMGCENQLDYEIHHGSIDSEIGINFLDSFSQKFDKLTVVVMAQASIHTSNKILEKLEEWQGNNLDIFWLPTYSPKHNLIEIFWKFIKYEWIEIEAYENWKSFLKYLKKVLDNFGKEYVINFV